MALFSDSSEDEQVYFEQNEMPNFAPAFFTKFLVGTSLLGLSLLMPFFLKIMLMIFSASLLIPIGKSFFKNQIKQISLKGDSLFLKMGWKGRDKNIPLSEISSFELVEKFSRRNYRSRRNRNEVSTVLFEAQKSKSKTHPDTTCVLTLNTGEKVELEAKFFAPGSFNEFVSTLQELRHSIEKSERSTPKIAGPKKMKITLSPEEEKINKLIAENRSYIEKDNKLRKELEDTLTEAYCTTFRVRNAFELGNLENPTILHRFKKGDNTQAYIVDGDFMPGITQANVDMAYQLIVTTEKNIALIDQRIESHKILEENLIEKRFYFQNIQKLKGLQNKLDNLQETNTNRSMDTDFNAAQIEIEANVLSELEQLTHQVHSLESMDKAIALNEHISLFLDGEDKRKKS